MIYVVVEELIPDSQIEKHSNIATVGLAVGFVIDKVWVAYAKLWIIDGMEGVPYVQSWKQVLIKRAALAVIWLPLSAVTAGMALLLERIVYA